MWLTSSEVIRPSVASKPQKPQGPGQEDWTFSCIGILRRRTSGKTIRRPSDDSYDRVTSSRPSERQMQSHQIGVCRISTSASVRTTASHLSLLSAPIATSRIVPVSSPATIGSSSGRPYRALGNPQAAGLGGLASELGSLAVLGAFYELPYISGR